MTEQSKMQIELMEWFGKMLECVETLPPDERSAFEQWDKQRPQGVATSDWPGFDKYLPKKPMCEHIRMKRNETVNHVIDRCPDCGWSGSSTREEVAEFAQEVMDDFDSRSK